MKATEVLGIVGLGVGVTALAIALGKSSAASNGGGGGGGGGGGTYTPKFSVGDQIRGIGSDPATAIVYQIIAVHTDVAQYDLAQVFQGQLVNFQYGFSAQSMDPGYEKIN